MKIAVPYVDGLIYQHFGHAEAFQIYEVENGQVTESFTLRTYGSGHSALAGFLAEQGVGVLICGGIGGCARCALDQAGIQIFGGVHGEADDAVERYLLGELSYDPAAKCDHHSCGGHC